MSLVLFQERGLCPPASSTPRLYLLRQSQRSHPRGQQPGSPWLSKHIPHTPHFSKDEVAKRAWLEPFLAKDLQGRNGPVPRASVSS